MKYLILLLLSMSVVSFSQSSAEQSFAMSSTIDEQDPPESIQVDTMPRPISPVAPKYPESARKLGVEAMIWLKMVINEKGDASKVVVFRSNTLSEGKGTEKETAAALSDLNAAAVDAAKQWKFTPAVLNGTPVKVWVTLPFKFKLDASKPEKNK